MLYSDLGQALQESFNISDKKRDSTIKDKKLNESKSINESVAIPNKLDSILEIADEHELLEALIRWLPFETLEKFAEDMAADWDLDYFEESLNEAMSQEKMVDRIYNYITRQMDGGYSPASVQKYILNGLTPERRKEVAGKDYDDFLSGLPIEELKPLYQSLKDNMY